MSEYLLPLAGEPLPAARSVGPAGLALDGARVGVTAGVWQRRPPFSQARHVTRHAARAALGGTLQHHHRRRQSSS